MQVKRSLSSAAVHCLLMRTIILKCMNLVLRVVLRFLFSGLTNQTKVTRNFESERSSLQPANPVDGQFTVNPQLSLGLYFLDPHWSKWGGNLQAEELQEVQVGLRPARKSATPCEPLPAALSPCPFPTTPGRSLKKRHGGQWWAGLDSCSPPSAPEPEWVGVGGLGEETTRAAHVSIHAFSRNQSIPESRQVAQLTIYCMCSWKYELFFFF